MTSQDNREAPARREGGPALIAVDVQHDFLPGGSLAVPDGDAVIEPLRRLAPWSAYVVATRDHHPADHVSFVARGGAWPPHCVRGTSGALLAPGIDEIADHIVSKGVDRNRDAYSGFQQTGLAEWLTAMSIDEVVIGGLATDYCVLETALDARRAGFGVTVLTDAIRAVDVEDGDGARALARMRTEGIQLSTSEHYIQTHSSAP